MPRWRSGNSALETSHKPPRELPLPVLWRSLSVDTAPSDFLVAHCNRIGSTTKCLQIAIRIARKAEQPTQPTTATGARRASPDQKCAMRPVEVRRSSPAFETQLESNSRRTGGSQQTVVASEPGAGGIPLTEQRPRIEKRSEGRADGNCRPIPEHASAGLRATIRPQASKAKVSCPCLAYW